MNIILRNTITVCRPQMISRCLSGSCVLQNKKWRLANGLSANRNAEGILTDGPDYSYLDGRPTPLLHKQKLRLEKQQAYASRIVELCHEVDFAKQRHQDIIKEKEEERQRILADQLKPKGEALNRKLKKKI